MVGKLLTNLIILSVSPASMRVLSSEATEEYNLRCCNVWSDKTRTVLNLSTFNSCRLTFKI